MFMLTHFLPTLFDNTRHKVTFLGEIVSATVARKVLAAFLANSPQLPADYLSWGQERCQGKQWQYTWSFT